MSAGDLCRTSYSIRTVEADDGAEIAGDDEFAPVALDHP
jgi:hypothetical protein